jgi:Flp pilus assembly protein TadG
MLEFAIVGMVVVIAALAVIWDLGTRYLERKDVATVADALAAHAARHDAITKTFLASVVELVTCSEADKKALREKYVSAGLRAKT